uniref:Uncharacterized protein n=1 Tax=Anguilla anguilla TaxID=7936 RepID=A0A0E9QRT1_ANGAN
MNTWTLTLDDNLMQLSGLLFTKAVWRVNFLAITIIAQVCL